MIAHSMSLYPMQHHSVNRWVGGTLLFLAVTVPAYSPTQAIEPRAGMWSVGGSGGIIGSTPNGTSFALNLHVDRFFNPNVSLGPLLQVANFEQVAPSLQFKYWLDVNLRNPDAKLNVQGGGGFVHVEGDTSYIVPLGLGLDYPVDRNFSLTMTLLLNFTGLDAGLGQGVHLMPSITVGLRY